MEHKKERSFGFLHINERGGKPRRIRLSRSVSRKSTHAG